MPGSGGIATSGLSKGGQRGSGGGGAFHNSIIGNFMIYDDRFETNLLQLFAHLENSEWLSINSVIIFEVNIAAEQNQAYLVTIF